MGQLRGRNEFGNGGVRVLGADPILVTGAHRSGTSWVGSMLAAASIPRVAYLEEPFNLERPIGMCPDRLPYWFAYVTPASAPQMRRSVGAMIDHRYATGRELMTVRTPRGLARLGRDRFRVHRAHRRQARPLIKDPIAVFSAEWLADSFDMDVVVCVRHPAGFAGSLVRLGWRHPFDHFLRQPELMHDLLAPFADEIRWYAAHEQPVLAQAALLWKLIYSTVDGYRARRPAWSFVRLEDLAADPVGGFIGLYRRTGLVFDENAYDAIRRSSAASNPTRTAGSSQIRRNSPAAADAWRSTLAPRQVAQVRRIVGDVAERFYPEQDWGVRVPVRPVRPRTESSTPVHR